MKKWDLSKLYESYTSKAFLEDLKMLDMYLEQANSFKQRFINDKTQAKVLTDYLLFQLELGSLLRKLFSFVSLNSSTNTVDKASARYMVILQKKASNFTEVSTLFSIFVSKIENLDELIETSSFLKEHQFYLHETVKHHQYKLDEKTEGLLSKLNQSSTSLFSKMQRVLTSTLEIEFNGEILTLPEIIGKSEDKDQEIRKSAYETLRVINNLFAIYF